MSIPLLDRVGMPTRHSQVPGKEFRRTEKSAADQIDELDHWHSFVPPLADLNGANQSSQVPKVVVKRGDRGQDVLALQQTLVSLGYLTDEQLATGPGIFGPQTQAALQEMQTSAGIEPGEVYDTASQEVAEEQIAEFNNHQQLIKNSFQNAIGRQPTPSEMASANSLLLMEPQATYVELKHLLHATLAEAPQNATTESLPSVYSGLNNPIAIANSLLDYDVAEVKTDSILSSLMPDNVCDNVNCASFVTATLAQAGWIDPSQHQTAIYQMVTMLQSNPSWAPTDDVAQLKPGDVLVLGSNGGYGHTVLFAGQDEDGNYLYVGSNNRDGDENQAQQINYQHLNPSEVSYAFHYRGNGDKPLPVDHMLAKTTTPEQA
jgi:peptidoglycan hydrolase-like protein with peptidoglycan-binding domain